MLEVRAPLTATVVDISVWPGKMVNKGEELMQLEAMKVYIPIQAPCTGRIVAVHISSGQVVQKESIMLVIECANS
ncbi:acetyl-CoA carboxylase biotin carboxyl carrier protein subunit [Thermosulfuriphilus ammonigenes]|uniref:Acetyl-CoA carboxylase biotin carboxyl carrier protein subunit n=1 Tax=Thermosulfuriphilus ammonigenes TaxID=1936021 RepID=A0A6G7PWA6_9BACT|nr:acetyl-CoA carboxylase biotin carboxyl carrier protein subunit [Thermosulfuriphilus ammonigenes]MBA2848014.1 biotin carboxyl carrier protein [Thermosulfuriphilus ammonigenes]QIJ71801.1 acetyl-CoA carboxylase biotin carboxyl carrier protein subunit [Thermosulfuriphilus ammonigenes]HFB83437.1 acetyl-CoA carboxylase biotin carboxyl carrier protein subunit [Thermodesulfatator sp.]